MKVIVKESMNNMPEVENTAKIAVDPVMGKAKLDSDNNIEEAKKVIENERKTIDLKKNFDRKEDAAFGTKKQPKPEEAEKELEKITLDESLFYEDDEFDDDTIEYTSFTDWYNNIASKWLDFADDISDLDDAFSAGMSNESWENYFTNNVQNKLNDYDYIECAFLAGKDLADNTIQTDASSLKAEVTEEYDDVETFCSKDMQNGNAFWIMGYTANAMKECGLSDEIKEMRERAMSSDYDNLCAVCDEYIQRCNEIADEIDDSYEVEGIPFVTDGLDLNEAIDKTKLPVIGTKIRIISMEGEENYNGREGEITNIDDIGQLHGTWGGLAVIPGIDAYEVIK